MKLKRTLCAYLAFALGTFTPVGFSAFDPVNDDTDIFLVNPTFTASRPNVLLILDNTANWNTPFAAEKAALVNTVNGLNDSFNVGLMMFTETGAGNGSPDGAYVRYAVRQMTPTNKKVLADMVNNLDINADKSNGGKTAKAMYEAFLYYGAEAPHAGANKVKRDYPKNTSNPAGSLGDHAFASDDVKAPYVTPIKDGCQKNYIIYISNGPAQDNASDLTVSENALKALNKGVNPSVIPLSPSGSQENWADEWTRHMANYDCHKGIDGTQKINTYTLDIGPADASGGQGPGWTALLKMMATQGKGKYFAVNNNDAGTSSAIADALNAIFTEIQAVNSVFASTTLPVSVNVRGTNLNQVYIGVFRPDAAKVPRWLGNLKMYKLAVSNEQVFLADAAGNPAEDGVNGFITPLASSFWTANSCFWSYLGTDPENATAPPGSCVVPTTYTYWSDKPDGKLVEKGGAAQQLRTKYPTSQATRKVYSCTAASGGTCASGTALSLTPFSTSNTHITALDVGAYTTYPVSTLVSQRSPDIAIVTLANPLPTGTDFPANGTFVRIEGASPTNFNGDWEVKNSNPVAGTFEYDLVTAFSGRTAIVTTSADHNVNVGDRVTATGGSPVAYNTDQSSNSACADSDPHVVTLKLDPKRFAYRLCDQASSGATTLPSIVVYKTAIAVSGSVNTAELSMPGHGFTSTFTAAIDTRGGNTSFNATAPVSVTVVNADTLRYTTPNTIAGTGAVKVNATGHGLKVGDVLTITGVTGGYNCPGTCAVQAVPDPNHFIYTPPTAISAAAGGSPNITATRTFITTLTLGNGSGGTRNLVTATAPPGTTLDLSTTTWKASVSGASNTNFDISLATITDASSVNAVKFNVASPGPTNNTTLTPANSGTVTFTRNAMTTAASAFVQTVTYAGTIDLKVSLITGSVTPVTSVSVRNTATGVITAGKINTGNEALRTQIINWVRGADNAEGEISVASSDVRPSVHGDVLHSRPAVVNYNRYGDDNDIYIFYGSNDGMIRAVKGGTASSETGINPGDERWSFIPREFFSKFKRLRNNFPLISSSNPRDYTGDGPMSIYVQDAVKADGTAGSDGILSAGVTGPAGQVDKVQMFIGFRRGLRALYALDVTDPSAPKFMWKKTNADTDYGELGFTWSEPKVAKLKINVSGTAVTKPVLIFGGGYDPQIEDINPCLLQSVNSTSITLKAIGTGTITYTQEGSCTISGATGGATTRNRSMGRGIFIVDAETGAVIWQAGAAYTTGANGSSGQARNVPGMTCAIPSDVTVVDIDREGHADMGYVGDTCGNVWRINIADPDPANWVALQVGSAWSGAATDIANKRRFLFPPDVVLSSDSTGNYAAVLIGSGDREHPFATNTTDRFYMFKDRTTGSTFAGSTSCNAASSASAAIEDSYLDNATDQVANKNHACGFQITLRLGEKNVGSAVTIAGTTFFGTNQPSSAAGGGACGSNLGIARAYTINFEDASTPTTSPNATPTIAGRSEEVAGGGFLPSPVPAVVDIDGKTYQVVVSGTRVSTPVAAALDTRTRTYWYKEFD